MFPRMLAGTTTLVLVLCGCSGDESGVGPDPIVVGPPAALTITAGQDQSGTVRSELPQALGVVLQDADGHGVEGRSVTYVVTAGGGTLFLGASTTDQQGRAADRWVLGTSASVNQRAEARVVDAATGQGFVVEFRATAKAAAPSRLTLVAGDGQIGLAAQPLDDSLAVRAADPYGNPSPGASVAWAVSGGGAVSPASSVTDGTGTARTRWVLGPLEGVEQKVTATAASIAPVEFRAQFRGSSWDFGSGSWEEVASLPYAVRAPTAATDGEKIYVFGGYTPQGTRSNHTQIYDPTTDEWSLGANSPVALDFAFAATSSAGLIHLMGGVHDGAGRSARHFVYDPAADHWTESVGLPIGVSAPSGGFLAGEFYLAGGVTGSATRHREVQVFDDAKGTWRFVAPYPVAQLNAVGAVIDGKLHVAGGGLDGYGTGEGYYAYDPVYDRWTAGPPMPARRETLGGGTTAGNFCVFGGRLAQLGGFNTPRSDTLCFDMSSGAWRLAASLPSARAELTSVSLQGWIYAIGGHDSGNTPMSTVYRFTGETPMSLAPHR